MKLLITIDLKDRYLEMIKDSFEDIELVKEVEIERQKEEIINADIMITGGETSRELLLEAGQLKWIQTWSAGVEAYMDEEIVSLLKEKNIRLISMSGIHGDPIAETVMGYLINHSRRLHEFYDLQKERKWERLQLTQLAGKTMVIVGTGSIGLEIARKAKAFKMKTIGVKRKIDRELEYIDELYSSKELSAALNEGDYIVVSLPLTETTRGIFGEKEFASMKRSAFFVNIGRGGLVDEQDLITALEKGLIAGAGLDVFHEEPLAADSPLYQLENVQITPHISGVHPDYNQNAVSLFLENLQRYIDGEEMKNIVNYSQGY